MAVRNPGRIFKHITFCQLKVRNGAGGQKFLQKFKKKKNEFTF